jgi:hypothetical protein
MIDAGTFGLNVSLRLLVAGWGLSSEPLRAARRDVELFAAARDVNKNI